MSFSFSFIEKPTLLLDADTARRNIHRMATKADRACVRFRPHFKTHQSAEIGEWFRAEGVSAITTSSVDMAEYFADHGWDDITIAFSANLRQARTLNALAERIHLGLLVESVDVVKELGEVIKTPVNLWMKIDAGAHRTGLPWHDPEPAAQVAKAIQGYPQFWLRGLLTHAGHTYKAHGAAEVCDSYTESVACMQTLCRSLQSQGLDGLEISVGDTPGTSLCEDLGPVDEIRPGNFVFYDAQQVQIGSCGWEDVAVALACPVVACHPEREEVVVYGGAIHLSKDYLMNGDQRSYGMVCLPDGERWGAPLEGSYVAGLSQEHGILHMRPEDMNEIAPGDLVCILPAHSCLTVTLMKTYLTLQGQVIDTLNR